MRWSGAQEAKAYQQAEGQHGVLSLEQLRELGCSERTLRRRVRAGCWRRIFPGVYRLLAPTSSDWHQRLMAACLWVGEDAFVSHGAAARLHQLDGMDDERPVEVSTTGKHDGKAPEGVTVHRVKLIPHGNVTTLEGMRVTTVQRTLLDVAAAWPSSGADAALDSAIRKNKTTAKGVRYFLAKVKGRGRRGQRTLQALVDERIGDKSKDSELERMFMEDVVKEHGLPTPTHNFKLYDEKGKVKYKIDFAWEEFGVAIDLYGAKDHVGAKQVIKHDTERVNWIVAAGLRHSVYWYEDVEQAPEKIAEKIQEAIDLAIANREAA